MTPTWRDLWARWRATRRPDTLDCQQCGEPLCEIGWVYGSFKLMMVGPYPSDAMRAAVKAHPCANAVAWPKVEMF